MLVRVRSQSGLCGQAEAQSRPYTYGGGQASIVAAVRDERPAADRPERAAQRVAVRAGGGPGRRPRRPRGARRRALGPRRPAARAAHAAAAGGYATEVPVAHMVSLADPGAMAEEALEAHERFGVSSFKVKVGREPALDVAAVAAVRDALRDAELYVDANRGWTVEQALPPSRRSSISVCARSRSRSTCATPRGGGGSRPRARSRWPATRAARASRPWPRRATRARSGRSASRPPARASPSRAGSPRSARAATRRRRGVAVRGCDRVVRERRARHRARGHLGAARRGDEVRRSRDRPGGRGAADRGRVRHASQAPGLGLVVDEDALRHHRVDG